MALRTLERAKTSAMAQNNSEDYGLEDGMWLCLHKHGRIEKACCPLNTLDCGCYGQDMFVCPNRDCTGITDSDVEKVFEGNYE